MLYIFHQHDNMNKPVRYGLLILAVFLQIHGSTNNSLNPPSTSSRSSNALNCPVNPQGDGECCIASKHALPTYDHTDENGHTCSCEYCRSPKFVVKECVCTPGITIGEVECGFPIKGKTYMPPENLNNCTNAFNCTIICPGNLTLTKECQKTEDAICGCKEDEGFYQSGESTCSEIISCDANFKRDRFHPIDSIYPSYRCVPCGKHEDCTDKITTTPVNEVIASPVLKITTGIRLTTAVGIISSTPTEETESHTDVTKPENESNSRVFYVLIIIVIVIFTVVLLLFIITMVWIHLDRRRYNKVKTVNADEGNKETTV